MDVSDILTLQASKQKSILVEKDIPPEVDAGFLTVTDINPLDKESYDHEREAYLQANSRDGVQVLVAALFSLPTIPSPEGPLGQLPAPTTQLPREKPLPKPKLPTKWEKFARAKGIQSQRRDRKVWDEESQTWVPRWGWKGRNKAEEAQWLHEVPANADVDYDPSKEARAARKTRMAKNEGQRLKNLARSQHGQASTATAPATKSLNARTQSERKGEIQRTLVMSRASTASMGKFDRMLEGEKKPRGVKRKFEPTERSVETEKSANLALIRKLENSSSSKRAKRGGREDGGGGGDRNDVLNVRKAVRFASGGEGAVALARKSAPAADGRRQKWKVKR